MQPTSTPNPNTHPDAGHHTPDIDEIAADATAVAGGAFRVLEFAPVVLIGLLICPPLAIAAFVVVAPLAVIAVVLGLLAAVISTPFVLVHHFRGHDGGHLALLVHRLRHAGRALFDLAPHRIAAGAREVDPGR